MIQSKYAQVPALEKCATRVCLEKRGSADMNRATIASFMKSIPGRVINEEVPELQKPSVILLRNGIFEKRVFYTWSAR